MNVPGRRAPLLLELDLTHPPAKPEADDLLARLQARSRPQLRPILRALHEAGPDPRVTGFIAKVGGPLPWALAQELRRGVLALAASGKPTLAWAESFPESDTAAYVLATAFDEIWLQPGGTLGLLGVGLETTFLRGALDKLGVEPQFEQRHEYKNAADRFTRTSFTESHKEALEQLAASLFDGAVADIAERRALLPQQVRQLADSGPRTAAEAKAAGLIDRLGYRDEAHAAMRERVGEGTQLLFADHWHPPRRVPLGRRKGHVALVEVHGGIGSGRTRRSPVGKQAGSDSVAAALRAAAADDSARAVVLHVNSPGGSAVASEAIWREVVRVKHTGKPVVVAMGELAASGGYYVACPADVIVALPATLTGSIGVFGGKFVTNRLLERLGLTTGTVQRGERALMFSSRRGFDEPERERFAATVDAIYADFVGKVAEGRGRSFEEIDKVARGRVWTGRDALRHGLVDEIGGLRDAVRIARERAGLPDAAPVKPALHIPPLARVGRPKNSDDPRAWARAGLSASLSASLSAPWSLPGADSIMLLMPPIRVR